MMNNSKIIEILNQLNLTKTADALKSEIGLIEIKSEEKKNLIEKITNQLVLLSATEKDKTITKIGNIKETKENKENKDLNDKLFQNLISKVSKNFAFKNDKNDKTNKPIKILRQEELEKTNVYNNLLNKITKYNKFTREGNNNQDYMNESYEQVPSYNEYQRNKKDNDKNIPRFGTYEEMNILDSHTIDSKQLIGSDMKNKHSIHESKHDITHNEVIVDDSFIDEEALKEGDLNLIQDSQFKKNKLKSKEIIDSENIENSFFLNNSNLKEDQIQEPVEDEYVDDEDPGFDLFECEMQYFKDTCKKLSEQYGFPRRAIRKKLPGDKDKPDNAVTKTNTNDDKKEVKENKDETLKSVKILDPEMAVSPDNKGEKIYEVQNQVVPNKRKNLLPTDAKYMPSGDKYYPMLFNNTIYDSFYLNVIMDRERTGFEESKDFKIIINSLIAARYQVLEYLGSAVFSKAIKVS